MRTIHKYPLGAAKLMVLQLPADATVLDVQVQRDQAQMWVLLDDAAPRIDRTFYIYGTGWNVDEGVALRHVGTFQLNAESFVFHVFEASGGPEQSEET